MAVTYLVMGADRLLIGDVVRGLLPQGDGVVTDVQNNPTFPRRINLTLGNPTDGTLPSRVVTLNRQMLISVSRAA
jgi:hypothetical protein